MQISRPSCVESFAVTVAPFMIHLLIQCYEVKIQSLNILCKSPKDSRLGIFHTPCLEFSSSSTFHRPKTEPRKLNALARFVLSSLLSISVSEIIGTECKMFDLDLVFESPSVPTSHRHRRLDKCRWWRDSSLVTYQMCLYRAHSWLSEL